VQAFGLDLLLNHVLGLTREIKMARQTLLEEEKIEDTILGIPMDAFTVLDFIDVFRDLYPADWQRLIRRFGQFGQKRRYTATSYLSHRLCLYSRKRHSLLQRFTSYSEAKFEDYRRATDEERDRFGCPWIAIFKKS
jgi:hypothetical protein